MRVDIGSDSRYSVLRATEALSNWRALALIGIASVATGVLYGIGSMLGMIIFSLIALVGLVVMAVGASAAGICLLDQARGSKLRSLPEYVMAGLAALPRTIGLLLLILAAYVALFVIAAILLFICKIPYLGAVVLVVLIPVLVAVFAAVSMAVYVMMILAAPAVWDGLGVLEAFSAALRIVRTHSVAVITRVVLGLILCMLISFICLTFVLVACMQVGGLSTAIIGTGGFAGLGLGGFGGMGGGYLGTPGMSYRATAYASLFGYGIVYAIVAALLSMMPAMVSVLVWLEFSAKIDLNGVKADAASATNSLQKPAEQATATPSTVPVSPAPVSPVAAQSATVRCPRCAAEVPPGDVFCSACGHRMN